MFVSTASWDFYPNYILAIVVYEKVSSKGKNEQKNGEKTTIILREMQIEMSAAANAVQPDFKFAFSQNFRLKNSQCNKMPFSFSQIKSII